MHEDLIKIRTALEILSLNSTILKNFPYACCGNASNLIATYLESREYGEFQYILGQNIQKTKSHAWLLSIRNRHIIDLTADQFGFNKIIYMMEDEYPLLELFPHQKNKGNASILSGRKVDNSYYVTYKKLLEYFNQ